MIVTIPNYFQRTLGSEYSDLSPSLTLAKRTCGGVRGGVGDGKGKKGQFLA